MLRTGLQTAGARASLRAFQTLSRRTFTTTRSAPKHSFTFSSHPRPLPPTLLQRFQSSIRQFHPYRARLNGKPTSPNSTSHLRTPKGNVPEPEPQSLSARMKKLSREYGWSAVGVYFALSALDFPFCYLLVRAVGTEKIGHYEHIVVSNVQAVIPDSVQESWHEWRGAMKKAEMDITGGDQISEGAEMAGWGVEEAQQANKSAASLGTQLALAYAIHKSFIFIRVPITVAVTPKVVKVLRGWGWDIGKRTTKEAKAIKRAAIPPKSKKARRGGSVP